MDAGWVVSISHDPEVRSIRIKSGDTVIQREAPLNQPVVIQIKTDDRSDMDVKFEAVALSSSDEVLYRLDYEINGKREVRWIVRKTHCRYCDDEFSTIMVYPFALCVNG